MDKKNLIIIVGMIVLVVVGGIFLFNYINKDDNKKYYDWNARLIICKECSPYSQEPILLNSELEELRELLIFNFDEREIVFDSFGTNTIYINLTNEAYYKINEIIENINSDESIDTTITTIYYDRIIRQEEQKELSSEEEIYICEEDRECISVSAGCCGCNSGGQATTINEDYSNYWNNKLAEDCKGTGCAAVMSNHWTCFANPKCINNQCELIEKNCSKEGEKVDVADTDKYPENCCNGLTEWAAGFDTRISIGDECYATGMIAGAPYGICINCGNGVCEKIENVCNCQKDCSNGENSAYSDVEEFCEQDWIRFEEPCETSPFMKGFPICDLCEVSQKEILQIAKNSTSAKIEGVALNLIWNITNEEIIFLDNLWYVNLTANYDFGCCSHCGPGSACAAVCTSCGIKTIKNNFIINLNGTIVYEDLKEIACKENTGVWWRSRGLNGENCLIVEGEYECPGYDTLNCSPGIIPEIMWYCVEPYHQWIKENCNILFSY